MQAFLLQTFLNIIFEEILQNVQKACYVDPISFFYRNWNHFYSLTKTKNTRGLKIRYARVEKGAKMALFLKERFPSPLAMQKI